MLIEEAKFCWIGMKQMMEDIEESFKVRFMEEYFPNSVRYDKKIEFMQLEQENFSVTEYATRFNIFSTGRTYLIQLFRKALFVEYLESVDPCEIYVIVLLLGLEEY